MLVEYVAFTRRTEERPPASHQYHNTNDRVGCLVEIDTDLIPAFLTAAKRRILPLFDVVC